jgi:hypothetical protein
MQLNLVESSLRMLRSAWFQPLNHKVISWFQKFAFKWGNLCRYCEEDAKLAAELAKQQRVAQRNMTKGGKKAMAKKKKASKVSMDSDDSEGDDEDFSDDEFMPAPKVGLCTS